jgi:hypothetical protein
VNHDAVAELTIAPMLMAARRLTTARSPCALDVSTVANPTIPSTTPDPAQPS